MSDKIVEECLGRVSDWETNMSEFFGLWNNWANSYRMIDTRKSKRPAGVSKNITAETPRAVNALATTITSMLTAQDPYFELRSDEVSEDMLYQMEKKYQKMLTNLQFERNLLKGNRSMCLFGTQIWEEPYTSFPANTQTPLFEGTDFRAKSLLQVPFESSVYDINLSDFIGTIDRMNPNYLRFMANSGNGIWNKGLIEQGIKEKSNQSGAGFSNSSIEQRRQAAKYNESKSNNIELILWHGRLSDESMDTPEFAQMWEQSGRTDDPKFSDVTVGILNREHMVRFHPTPYGTWHHLFKIGHYMEFELEPIAYGVGKLGGELQKDMNRIMSYVNDVAKFSLWNIFLAGRGSGLKSSNMNVFPWSAIQVDDINQVKELRPQIEGILNGLKLTEITRDDFRGVTGATATLQAILTGATATESTLAQNEAIRALSVTTRIEAATVVAPHIQTMHTNFVDQNPYDTNYPRNVEVVAKATTDRDFRPEHTKKLLEFLNLATSIRQSMPIDFNPMPVLKYFARSVGINPRELKEPRPQIDKLLDVLRRTNADSEMKNEMLGEVAGMENQTGQQVSEPTGSIPNSPVQSLGVI